MPEVPPGLHPQVHEALPQAVRVTGVFVPSREDRPSGPGWIEDGSGCWIWYGYTMGTGYGLAHLPTGINQYAHRLTYERFRGPIPQGLTIDHLCRNRRCVNPWHLEPVTQSENNRRGYGWSGRHSRQTHCVHGHPFTEDNTYLWRSSRKCRTCRKAALERLRGNRG